MWRLCASMSVQTWAFCMVSFVCCSTKCLIQISVYSNFHAVRCVCDPYLLYYLCVLTQIPFKWNPTQQRHSGTRQCENFLSTTITIYFWNKYYKCYKTGSSNNNNTNIIRRFLCLFFSFIYFQCLESFESCEFLVVCISPLFSLCHCNIQEYTPR